jgi:hypothetical protein
MSLHPLFPIAILFQNLFIQYRFSEELPFPQISLTTIFPYTQRQMDLSTDGMKAPNTCSIVLVAEPFLQDLSAVMDMVDTVSKPRSTTGPAYGGQNIPFWNFFIFLF